MKDLALASILVASAMASGQSIKVGSGQAGVDQTYNGAYSRRHETTIVGYVTGKVKGTPSNGMAESVSILVRTSKNKVYQIDLGPAWYVRDQTATINVGDKVKVIGDPIVFDRNKEKVILARQVVHKKQVLALRDSYGVPYWNARRSGRVVVSGAPNTIQGQIVSENPVTAENQQQVGYQIQTPSGIVDVAVGPDWYLNQQNMSFKVGDGVTVYTGAAPTRFGNVIVANGLYGYGGTYMLRPGGIPVWNGWSPYSGPGY